MNPPDGQSEDATTRLSNSETRLGGGAFPATAWTEVLAAGDASSAGALEAMERLARSYWRPLHDWLRRQGLAHHEAEDAIQGLFTSLIQRQGLRHANEHRGKFRSFLLASLRNHLSDVRDRDRAIKRGGGAEHRSLDEPAGEASVDQSRLGPTPDTEFDRDWALTLIGRATAQVQREFEASERGHLFEHLHGFLHGDPDAQTHAAAAAQLGMSEAAVKMAGTRMRQRFQQLIRSEIRSTVESDGQVEEELGHLFASVARGSPGL